MYTHVHTHSKHMYTHMYIHMYIHVHTCTYMYIHMYTHMHTHSKQCNNNTLNNKKSRCNKCTLVISVLRRLRQENHESRATEEHIKDPISKVW